MSIIYRIYANHGDGGPVDFSAPIATTSQTSYVTGSLAASTDNTFVVRAFDPVASLEEANTDARVRVVVGPDGSDVTNLPNPPQALTVNPTLGGGCQVVWAYAPVVGFGTPTGFSVYLSQGPTVDYSTPTSAVPYVAGQLGYRCDLAGPLAPVNYLVAVRAVNQTGTEANTTTVAVSLGIPNVPYVMDAVQATVG